ncbi:MAG: hypothetical protein HY718_01970 [Planctomycetes bacterium]|nr:hypothetical protein [Planctomycetota bacterium]
MPVPHDCETMRSILLNALLLNALTIVAALSAGCATSVRVQIDCRVAPDAGLRQRLAGPRYVIRAVNEQAEASLAFQEFADTFAAALEMRHPDLRRVEVTQPAEFAILLQANVTDLGTGVTSYPVYGHYYGHGYGPYGPIHYSSFGVVGTEVRAVHLGYNRTLFVSAYVLDPAAPGGRRVLWEGMAGSVGDESDLAAAMPYLSLALSSHFGESSEGQQSLRFEHDDSDVKALRLWLRTGEKPATRPASQPTDH